MTDLATHQATAMNRAVAIASDRRYALEEDAVQDAADCLRRYGDEEAVIGFLRILAGRVGAIHLGTYDERTASFERTTADV